MSSYIEIETPRGKGIDSSRLLLRLMLTEQCNFRCRYCYTEKRDVFMGVSIVSRAIEFSSKLIYNINVKNLAVEFTGGEPLLATDILFEGLDLLVDLQNRFEQSIDVTIITNAYLLDEALIRRLKGYKLPISLRVSMDGVCAEDFGRRVPGEEPLTTCNRIAHNIRNLTDAGMDLTINAVVTPARAKSLVEDFFFLYDLSNGAYVKLSPVLGVGWSDEEIEDLRESLAEIRRLISLHPAMFASKRWIDELAADRRHADYIKGIIPQQLPLSFTIDPTGMVYEDEFEPRTRDLLKLGSLEELLDEGKILLQGRSSMSLLYEHQIYSPRVLESQAIAYDLIAQHANSLIGLLDTSTQRQSKNELQFTIEYARSLIHPLKENKQQLKGFVLAEISSDGNSAIYRFYSAKDKSRISVALLPKESVPHAYATTQKFAIVVKSESKLQGISTEIKRLIRAFQLLILKNE